MKKIELEKFDLKVDKEKVLTVLGCLKGNSVYDTVSRYYDELYDEVKRLARPYAVMYEEDMTGYCIVSVGDLISGFSRGFFEKGEGMKGLLADAMADEFLFAVDSALSEQIKYECAGYNLGVGQRMSAPGDIPITEQKMILDKTGAKKRGIGITEAFMFSPVKTMGYVLKFTSDSNVFNAQHDCSKCANLDCPRRSMVGKGTFEVLSDYEYKPELGDGESAVCIDIGTTTVAFELIAQQGTLKKNKTINPQRRFGMDVLSRIDAANRGRGEELASLIRYTLINGYRMLTGDFDDADKIIIAGNTTMVHLLMGYSCDALGKYPFKSEYLGTLKTTFDRLTRSNSKPVPVVVYGGISAFVGGDIVSGLYMCDFDNSDTVNMFIDLGTNGEMAVGDSKKITVTSTAAGPAFEGGRISCGVGSVDGAVCGVDLSSRTLKTINGKPPVGLCGTGIIELVSELLDKNIIDGTGLMSEEYFTNGYRVAEDIFFNQQDIRQVQMAKSAVRAGIETLVKRAGVGLEDIDTVYLAGGFGYGLSVEKACRIGILPKEFLGKTKVIGNSSLGGCAKYCSNTDADRRIEHIKSISEEISLGNLLEFQKLYIEYMNF